MNIRLMPAVVLMFLAGCSKVHEERQFTLEPAAAKMLEVTAPVSQQKVKITMTADNPVNIYLVLTKDVFVKLGEDFDPETMKTGILASEKKVTSATLTATIPAKEAYRIYCGGAAKQTSVTIKIDSQ